MRAQLNFVTPGADGTVRFALDHGWTGTRQRPVTVDLIDARPLAQSLSLDREGFVIDRTDSGVTDYRDMSQIEQRWMPAVKETILRATGASWAVLFAGPNIRFSERDPGAYSTQVSAPARAVHSDLHGQFRFEQLRVQPLAEAAWREIDERLEGREPPRWRVFNLWQMISEPPQDVALALCALDSVAADDVVEAKGFFSEPEMDVEALLRRTDAVPQFDLTFFKENPAQRWHCFPSMQPGETLIFSAFDPQADSRKARVPHGAVDLPPAAGRTIPRNSIEIRAMVIY
jgi:hypothetical protein